MGTSRTRFVWLISCLTVLPAGLASVSTAAETDDSPPVATQSSKDIYPKLAQAEPTADSGDLVEQASLVEAAQPAPTTPPALPDVNVIAEPPIVPPTVNNPNPVPPIMRGTVYSSPPVNGYNAPSSTVGTIFNTPNVLFPGTINSVTRDTLRDQQVLNMDDVLRDVAGAVKSYGADGTLRADQFFMRGFEVTSQNWRRNGFLDPTYVPRDPANIERIDVLKGPSSVLYGAAGPTGTWNVTTKKALIDPYYWGGITTGSYGLQRYAFDAGGALNDDKTFLYRLNGVYQNVGSFRDTVFNERTFVAPVFTYLLDDETSISWEGEYQHDRRRADNGIPALGGDPFAVGRTTYFGNPGGDIQDYQSYRSTLSLTKILNDDWTFYLGGSSLWYDVPSTSTVLNSGTSLFGASPTPATINSQGFVTNATGIPRDQTQANPFNEQNQAIISNLTGEFDGWFFRHKALIGTEQDWFITNHDKFSSTSNGALGNVNALASGPFPITTPVVYDSVFDNPSFRQNRQGYYAQDWLEVNDRWKVLLGGRFDYLDQTYARNFGFGEVRTEDSFNQFSPKVGVTYEAIPNQLTYYGVYSKSFVPSVGVSNLTTTVLRPQIGDIWEGGIKTQLRDNLLWTVGGFWTSQKNVNVEFFDPTSPTFFTLSQAGEQHTQGIETSLTGQVTPRMSTIFNYAYNDSVLGGIAQPAGGVSTPLGDTRPRGVPHSNANAWTRYNFVQNRQETIGAALGTVYVGERLGDYSSPLMLPSYTRWDTGFYFNRGRFNAMLYWENIFNINYITSSISQYQVFPGAPMNCRVQVGMTF
jgi:iron complex outermembrane receptor protein